jgi:hypothetical protein
LRRLPDAKFLISERSGVIDGEMVFAGKNLRLIQRMGSIECEPIRPDYPLLTLARDSSGDVLLTPYTAAGGSQDLGTDPPRSADYENIVRVLRGQSSLHQVP